MGIVLSISLLYTMSFAKTNWINFRVHSSKIRFLHFGVCMIAIVTRLFYIKAFVCRSKSTSSLLKRIDHLNSQQDNDEGNLSKATNRVGKTSVAVTAMILLVSTSILMSCAVVVFGDLPFKKWDFEYQQLTQAYDTGESLFIWNSKNWENETDVLDEKYGTNMTTAVVSLAVAGDILTFVGSLHENLMIDFWAVVAMQLLQSRQSLIEMLQESNYLDFLDPDEWNYYLQHRQICDEMDKIYGLPLAFVHPSPCWRYLINLKFLQRSSQGL